MSDANLTDREAEIVRLRELDGLSLNAIAERLGTSKGSVSSSLRAAKRKQERADFRARNGCDPVNGNATERKDPEKAAALIDNALEPFASIEQAAKEVGFPPSTARRLIERMKTRHKALHDTIRETKDKELTLLLTDRARRCLEFADDFAMAGANVKDLMVAAGIAIDKARLLQGQPTSITRLQDVQKLDDQLQMIAEEMQRRGLMIDITPGAGQSQG